MVNDGRNYGHGKLFAGERSQDCASVMYGLSRTIEINLSVTFGEQRAGHARRAATRQCDFLPERKLRQACEQLIFGVALQLRGNPGQIATCTRSIK